MEKDYEGPERRSYHEIPDELIDHIAERAADKAAEKVFNQIYQEIGRNVLKKAAWLVGLIIISVSVWLAGQGIIKS